MRSSVPCERPILSQDWVAFCRPLRRASWHVLIMCSSSAASSARVRCMLPNSFWASRMSAFTVTVCESFCMFKSLTMHCKYLRKWFAGSLSEVVISSCCPAHQKAWTGMMKCRSWSWLRAWTGTQPTVTNKSFRGLLTSLPRMAVCPITTILHIYAARHVAFVVLPVILVTIAEFCPQAPHVRTSRQYSYHVQSGRPSICYLASLTYASSRYAQHIG